MVRLDILLNHSGRIQRALDTILGTYLRMSPKARYD